MKKLLLLVFLPLLFSNCSSDDDISGSTSSVSTTQHPIIGTWKYLEVDAIIEGTSLSNETKQQIYSWMDPSPSEEGEMYIIFNADGTGESKFIEKNYSEFFTYTIEGNQLTLIEDIEDEDEGDDNVRTYEIKGNQLTIITSSQEELEYYQNTFPNDGVTRTDRTISFEKM